jgi:hypothetical protein
LYIISNFKNISYYKFKNIYNINITIESNIIVPNLNRINILFHEGIKNPDKVPKNYYLEKKKKVVEIDEINSEEKKNFITYVNELFHCFDYFL